MASSDTDSIKWAASNVVRSPDRARLAPYGAGTGFGSYTRIVLGAVFVTRWGRIFRGQESLTAPWSLVDSMKARGPWVTGPSLDVRYVLVAAQFVSGETYPSNWQITAAADPDGIDWEAPDLPPPFHGTMFTIGSLHFGAWRGSRSISKFQQEVTTGWITQANRLYHTDYTTRALSFQAITKPEKGLAWIRSEAEDNSASPGRRWMFGNMWGGPETQWMNYAYRSSRTVWPDGQITEKTERGVDGELHRWRVALYPAAPVPYTPAILTPEAPAWVEADSQQTYGWAYDGGMAGPQTGMALRRVIGGVTQWWNAAQGVWAAAEVVNPWAAQSVTIPAEATPAAGSQWTVAVAVRGTESSALSAYSAPLAVDNSAPPTADIAVDGRDPATGSVPELMPRVLLSGTPVREPLIDGEIRVTRASDGALVAARSGGYSGVWVVDVALDDGVEYVTAGRVRQTGGAWSAWASELFSVNVAMPDAAAVMTREVRHEESGAPGVLVTVVWPLGSYDWGTPFSVRVQRQMDWGSWEDLAVIGPVSGRRAFELGDWLPPSGVQRYRVRAEVATPSGGVIVSAWGESPPAGLTEVGGWLMPYGQPERAVRVALVEDSDREIDLRTEIAAPAHSGGWVVGLGVPTLPAGSMTARTHTQAERDALTAALTSGALLLLTGCRERDSYGVFDDGSRTWMRVVDKVQVARPSRGPYARRLVSWQYVTATPPAA